MLTQSEIDLLLDMLKKLVDKKPIKFPKFGESRQLDLVSQTGKEKFIVDINRKGKIKISKCTFQNRYMRDIVLLRLDLDGPEHTNPDGVEIPPNHLHIYREGYETRWAYPIPKEVFSNPDDLVTTLIEFLQYCKVVGYIPVQGGVF